MARLVAGLVVLVLAAWGASARQEGPGPAPLQGPKVARDRVPGVEASFGDGNPLERRGQRPLPIPVFLDAIASLDESGPGLALSGMQRERIDGLVAEFRSMARDHIAAHASEIRELRRTLPASERARLDAGLAGLRQFLADIDGAGLAGGRPEERGAVESRPRRFELKLSEETPIEAGGIPDAGVGEMSDTGMMERGVNPQDAIARLREIRDAGPNPGDLQTLVWTELSEAQRAHVNGELGKARERIRAEAEERILRERAAKTGESEDKSALIEEVIARAREGVLPERLARRMSVEARERWEAMTPDQRERVVRRLLGRAGEE